MACIDVRNRNSVDWLYTAIDNAAKAVIPWK